ncbi:hypothetical protein B5V02_18550 [Mesorhizobium kowhaii]|uniref:Uncharacterized protein n=1 Tax=Mesorhizobium kowhaii TaxID=1300272 RepID=A0A2W7C288_9HYPH|nr:hypothetical protein B5V02_18550 [Mesorhizobium kowhaii]
MDCHSPDAWRAALAHAKVIGEKAGAVPLEIVLLTHTKYQINRTSLENFLGSAARSLRAGNGVPLSTGGNLRHATLQTVRNSARGTVVIAYYANEELVEKIDSLIGILGVVAVPELEGEIDNWIARWTPTVHGQAPAAPAQLIADPVVEKALTALSSWINRANGVLNPRDKEHADETLRILRAKGHLFEPEKIKSWAIKNGWQLGAADELARLTVRIGKLPSKPSLARYQNVQGKYESWRA